MSAAFSRRLINPSPRRQRKAKLTTPNAPGEPPCPAGSLPHPCGKHSSQRRSARCRTQPAGSRTMFTLRPGHERARRRTGFVASASCRRALRLSPVFSANSQSSTCSDSPTATPRPQVKLLLSFPRVSPFALPCPLSLPPSTGQASRISPRSSHPAFCNTNPGPPRLRPPPSSSPVARLW
jgi:hypothetical protein